MIRDLIWVIIRDFFWVALGVVVLIGVMVMALAQHYG